MGRKNFKSFRKTSFLKKTEGMTLIEAIVVITILGIMVVLVIFSFKPQLQMARARDSRRKADLKEISISLEDYAGDHPCYPQAIYQQVEACLPSDEIRPYRSNIPCDPETHQHYLYVSPDSCREYIIYANLELGEVGRYGSANYVVSSSNVRVIPTIPLPTSPPGGGGPPATSTPAPPAPTEIPDTGPSYGCFSGVCRLRGGIDCSPKYPAGCYGPETCGTPENPLRQCQ